MKVANPVTSVFPNINSVDRQIKFLYIREGIRINLVEPGKTHPGRTNRV